MDYKTLFSTSIHKYSQFIKNLREAGAITKMLMSAGHSGFDTCLSRKLGLFKFQKCSTFFGEVYNKSKTISETVMTMSLKCKCK